MIAYWFLYAWSIALLLGLAALLSERAVRALHWPARLLWMGAMLLSIAGPLVAALFAGDSAPGSAGAITGSLDFAPTSLLLDRVLLAGWILGSTALLSALVSAHGSARRAQRGWQRTNLSGTQVLVAPDFGPGVLVTGKAEIVLPHWALELRPELRELMLLHEREHVRSRDHWLIMLGLALIALFPLNPFLWWQFLRLKLALEMDCDARVLSGRQDVREYAALLLDVATRSRTDRLVLAAFAAPPHAIERRIEMMLSNKSRVRRTAVGVCAAGAIAVVAFACEMPEPHSPEAAVRSALGVAEEPPPPPRPSPTYTVRDVGAPCCIAKAVQGQAYSGEEIEIVDVKERRLPPPPPPLPGTVK